MQGYVFYDEDVDALEAGATEEKKQLWKKVSPVVTKILGSWDPVLADTGTDVVRWVLLTGPKAISEMPKYLEENLGMTQKESARVSAELAREVLGNFLQDSTVKKHESSWVGAVKPSEIDKEVDSHNEKVRKITASLPVNQDQESQTAARIIKSSGVALAGDLQVLRVVSILKSRLKDVRTNKDTELSLVRGIKEGGAGLDVKDVLTIMAIIEEELKTADKDLRKAAMGKNRKQISRELELAPVHSLQLVSQPTKPAAPMPVPQPQAPLQPQKIQQPQMQPQPQVVQPPPQQQSRPKMDDIVFTPELRGPVEELENMRIVDFRRLSPKADLSAKKIKDKIMLLRDESFDQYTRAVIAWKSSPVYTTYLKMLSIATKDGKINFASDAPAPGQEEMLKKEEVMAIVHLNRELLI